MAPVARPDLDATVVGAVATTGPARASRIGVCRWPQWPQTGRVARRSISEAEHQVRVVQAARRMIAKGERPSYRLVIAQSGFGSVSWSLIGLPGVVGIAPGDRAADAFDLLT